MTDFKRGDLVEVEDTDSMSKFTSLPEHVDILGSTKTIVAHAPESMKQMVVQTSVGTRIWVDKAWFKKVIND